MIYTGYKYDEKEEEYIVKESENREELENEDFEYIASTPRDKKYFESLLSKES